MPQRLLPALALFVTLLAFAPRAYADEKSHAAAVKRFFQVTEMEVLFDQTIEQMTDVQVQSNPVIAPYRATMLSFFRKYMSWASLEPELTKLYMQELSEAEIKELTKFYETPLGKKVLRKMPELTAKGAAIGQARVKEHIGELMQMVEAEQQRLSKETAATGEE